MKKRGAILAKTDQFHRLYKTSSLVLILLLMVCYTVSSRVLAATSASDLQKRKTALEEKLKADEAAKQQKQAEQAKLDAQIADLNKQIDGVQQKITDTQNNINGTQKAIDDKQKAINKKQDELAHEKDQQAETLRVMYETGDPSTLEVLVGSKDLSDFLTYQDYLDALEQHITATIAEMNQIKANLEADKKDLLSKKAQLESLKQQQQAYSVGLASQQAQKARLLANAKEAESQLAQEIADAKKVYSDVNSELSKLQEEARRRAAQRASGQIPKGVSNVGFQWPVAFDHISARFSDQTPFQNFHTGLDMVNYVGTPVYAAADGVISKMDELNYGYGHYVVITHNERFATLYGHFQSFASGLVPGQTIKRGDLIGYIGMTGWTTGPHLHFEIREYGVPVDPEDYLPSL